MSEPRDLENKAQAGVSFQRDLRLCPSAPDKRRCAQASVLQARGELPPPGSGLRSLAGASPNRPPRPELVQRVGIAGGLSHPDRARRKAVSYRSPECSSPCDPKDTGPRRSRTWGGGRPCPAPRPCTCHQGLFPDDAASGEMPEGPWKREGGLGSHPPPPLPFPAGRHRQRGLCAVQLLGFLPASGFSGLLLLALPPIESNHGAHSFQKASQGPAQPAQGS